MKVLLQFSVVSTVKGKATGYEGLREGSDPSAGKAEKTAQGK